MLASQEDSTLAVTGVEEDGASVGSMRAEAEAEALRTKDSG